MLVHREWIFNVRYILQSFKASGVLLITNISYVDNKYVKPLPNLQGFAVCFRRRGVIYECTCIVICAMVKLLASNESVVLTHLCLDASRQLRGNGI